jgi:hypothetical protein
MPLATVRRNESKKMRPLMRTSRTLPSYASHPVEIIRERRRSDYFRQPVSSASATDGCA